MDKVKRDTRYSEIVNEIGLQRVKRPENRVEFARDTGIVTGTAVGAGVGAALGAPIAGFGAAPGAGLGLTSGLAVGATVPAAIANVYDSKVKKKKFGSAKEIEKENFDSFLKETPPEINEFHKQRWLNADPDTYASYYADTASASIYNNIDPYLVMNAIVVNLLDRGGSLCL